MIDANIMALVDGRKRPTPEQINKYAFEMHTLLRATVNILNSTSMTRLASEAMLIRLIEETLRTIDETPTPSAEKQPQVPPPPHDGSPAGA